MKPRNPWSQDEYQEAKRTLADPHAVEELGKETAGELNQWVADYNADAREGWIAPKRDYQEQYFPTNQTPIGGPPEEAPLFSKEGRYKAGPRGGLLAGPRTEVALDPEKITVDELSMYVDSKSAAFDRTLKSASKARHLYSSPVYHSPDADTSVLGAQPYIYDEPSPEEMIAYLEKSQANIERPEYLAHWNHAIQQLMQFGDESKIYKEMADRRWQQTKRSFQRHGASIVRAQYSGAEEEKGFLNSASTQMFSAMEPLAAGLDMGLAMGLGREAISSIRGNQIHGAEAARALTELEEDGLFLPMAERIKAKAKSGLGMLGEVAGMFSGTGLIHGVGAVGAKLVGKMAQATPALLRGTKLGAAVTGGLAKATVTGALSGSTEALLARGVESLGDLARDEEPFAPRRDLMAETLSAGLFGAGGGALSGVVSSIAGGSTRNLRRNPGDPRARDLGKMREHLGPGVRETSTIGGITETAEMRARSLESLKPARLGGADVHLTPEDTALRGLEKITQRAGARAERKVLAEMAATNESFYLKHAADRRYMMEAGQELMRIAAHRKGIPFADDRVAVEALSKITEITPVRSLSDARMHRDADGFLRSMSRGDAIETYGEEFVAEAAQAMGNEKNIAFVVKVRKLNPREYDEAIKGLDREVNYQSARQKDPLYKNLRGAFSRDRDTIGKKWGETKARHHEQLNQLEARQRAFGLGQRFKDTGKSEEAQIRGVLKGATGAEGSTDEYFYQVLAENPALLREFKTARAVAARGRLIEGYGDVPGSRAALIRRGTGAVTLRVDPLAHVLEAKAGLGGRTGILGAHINEDRRYRGE